MRRMPTSARWLAGFVCAAAVAAGTSGGAVRAQSPSAALSDAEFWRLTTELSEPAGRFAQQLMSNEDSAEFVIPALKQAVRPGGIYLGVGSEQNFTYLAALRPRLAFVVDIRRENLIEMLMYKALIELSADRADLVSRLFSRRRPDGLAAASGVGPLFDAYASSPPDSAVFERTTRDVIRTLMQVHGFAIDETDRTAIANMLDAFRRLGPDALKGYGDRTNPTYAELMAATDLEGRQQGFLASEENYRAVRRLEEQNLIVGVVGDFAGNRTVPGIGDYLRARRAQVDVFYVSNVERYLFEQSEHGRQFYRNVEALPLSPSSVFIRSVTRDISQRLDIPIPAAPTKWWTFLFPIHDCLAGLESGRIQSYRDLFVASR